MIPASHSQDELHRLEELRQYRLSEPESDGALTDLVALAAQICGTPIALITLVGKDHVMVQASVGISVGEAPCARSFCDQAIRRRDLFIVPDAAADERFVAHPMAVGEEHIRFYAGCPLVSPSGHALGVLCVMDRVGRQLSDPQQEGLRKLGRLVMSQLHQRRQARELAASEERLRIVTENARVGLVVVDADRRYAFANKTHAKIFGHSSTSVVGQRVADVQAGIYEDQIRPQLDRAFAGERGTYEVHATVAGTPRQSRVKLEPLRIDGAVAYVVAVITDITEAKAAEATRAQEHRELQLILDSVPAMVFFKDREGRFLRVNRRNAQLNGKTPQEFVGKTDTEMGFPGGAGFHEDDLRVMNSGEPMRQIEEQIQTVDGVRWVLTDKVPSRDESGLINGLIGFSVDITERKQAKEELAEAARFAHSIINALAAQICVLDDKGGILATNDAWRQFGREFPSIKPLSDRGTNYLDICERAAGPDSIEAASFASGIRRVLNGEIPSFTMEYPCHSPTEQRWFVGSVVRFTGEGPVRLVVAHTDITERKRLELAAERLAAIVKFSDDAIIGMDLTGVVTSWNHGAEKIFGYSAPEMVGTSITRLIPRQRLSEETLILEKINAAKNVEHFETKRLTKDGRLIDVAVTASPISDATGRIIGASKVARDITARKTAEDSLRETQERFRELAENIEEVFWMSDPAKNKVLYVSPAYEKIWGRTCASLYAAPREWLDSIHPEDRERIILAAETKQAQGTYDETYRILRPDGSTRWIRDRAFPIRDDADQIRRIAGTATDISETRQLEHQFRQSQKMEAIGQLAGGVAHDFNNILTAMMMQADLASLTEDLPAEAAELLDEIKESAERAANLTRQLLAFSRRQVMQPRDIDLNDIVTSLSKMLQRTLGEDVHLQLNLHPRPVVTRADPGMLDQVLINLAVNARDAMASGGSLFIETSERALSSMEAATMPEATPGRHVCLSVTDTGSGIDPEIASRIFEPFFTTKEPGKGTGLGLATVFGIVRQHGGSVTMESTPGKGATFQILLPAKEGATESPNAPELHPKSVGGSETILLVEDDPSVRILSRVVLERSGYRVVEASNGKEALRVWDQEKNSIDLLLTDIVMPGGISGRELGTRLREQNPDLRIIYTSGYSAEIAGQELTLQIGQNFIQKPVRPNQLLEALRRSLDA
jgi:two-component system, cell cycle sensor histidine kinase and response regulator CckA